MTPQFQTLLFETWRIILLAAAVSAVSVTITMASIFDVPRERLKAKSEFWGKLFSCPYCLSHWLAVVGIIFFRPVPIETGWWIGFDYVASWAMLIAFAALFTGKIKVSIFDAPAPAKAPTVLSRPVSKVSSLPAEIQDF